jgi:hypothetical protein
LIQEIECTDQMDEPPPPSQRIARKASHLRLVVSRNEPVTLHFEMADAMRELVAALEVTPSLKLVR